MSTERNGQGIPLVQAINPAQPVEKLLHSKNPDDMEMVYRWNNERQSLLYSNTVSKCDELGLTLRRKRMERFARNNCSVVSKRSIGMGNRADLVGQILSQVISPAYFGDGGKPSRGKDNSNP